MTSISSQPVRHIFFDLDRTLWDFDTNSRSAISDLYTKYNLADSGMPEVDTFFTTYDSYNDHCWEEYRNNRMSKNYLRHHRFFLTFQHYGLENRTLARKIGEDYINVSPYKNALIDGAVDVLEYLSPKYKLHIITNGFEEVQHIKLRESGIAGYFSQIITSERAACRKPDPKIFQHALEMAGAEVDECIMIGDDWKIDVQGALTVGMRGIWFGCKTRKPEDAPTAIHCLRELKTLL